MEKLNTTKFKLINMIALLLCLPFSFFTYGSFFGDWSVSGLEAAWYGEPYFLIPQVILIVIAAFMTIKNKGKEETIAVCTFIAYAFAVLSALKEANLYTYFYYNLSIIFIFYVLLAGFGIIMSVFILKTHIKTHEARKALVATVKNDFSTLAKK